MNKPIEHYFDWDGPEDKTLCGIELTKDCYVHWTTEKREVTCKRCLAALERRSG
jgi:hypothetical protein